MTDSTVPIIIGVFEVDCTFLSAEKLVVFAEVILVLVLTFGAVEPVFVAGFAVLIVSVVVVAKDGFGFTVVVDNGCAVDIFIGKLRIFSFNGSKL